MDGHKLQEFAGVAQPRKWAECDWVVAQECWLEAPGSGVVGCQERVWVRTAQALVGLGSYYRAITERAHGIRMQVARQQMWAVCTASIEIQS